MTGYLGTVLDSPKLEITGLFSDSLGVNLGLFSDSPELRFRDCFGAASGLVLNQSGPLCVTAKTNNMIGCVNVWC